LDLKRNKAADHRFNNGFQVTPEAVFVGFGCTVYYPIFVNIKKSTSK